MRAPRHLPLKPRPMLLPTPRPSGRRARRDVSGGARTPTPRRWYPAVDRCSRRGKRCSRCTLLSGWSEREQCRRTLARCSVPSLAAGLLFGSLAGLGAYQLSQDPRNIWVFLATSGTLAGIMGMRFYHSGKFLPAGLIAGASLLMVAKLGISVLNRPHQ
uniref:Transmembrane protein 14C n=1 Tax=Lynx canadensis TaxID=61383 RepID=A0A667IEG0_LYNCA